MARRVLDRLAPHAHLLAPATAVAFGLVVLRGELLAVWTNHDGAVHEAMIRYASRRIADGHQPFDGWFPYLTTGHPQMHHYQSLPAILASLVGLAGVGYPYGWTLYVLLCTWPLTVYAGARLLGWDRWVAGAAALLAPLVSSVPGIGFEWGAYTFGGMLGVWTQLWGMWLLPLAWGLSWRVVTERRGYASAAVAVGLTVGLHFLTGYLAAVAVGVWVLVAGRGIVRRLGRAAVLAVGSAGVAAWILVPFVLDRNWGVVNKLAIVGFWLDSYGAGQIVRWLVSGRLFDAGRPPVVTILFGVGFVMCVLRIRRDVRARAILGVWLVSFVLFLGRPTFAWLIDRLPLGEELLLGRFINGVHLAGLIVAGAGAAWIAQVTLGLVRRVRLPQALASAAVVVLAVAVLFPAWNERAREGARSAEGIEAQRRAELIDKPDVVPLIEEVERRGDGRVFAGFAWEWGAQFRVGLIPVHRLPLYEDVDSIGYTFRTSSVLTDVEAKFDERNIGHYEMFGVRYLIFPAGRRPRVPAEIVEQRGRFVLWRVETPTAYLKLVHTTAPITADRDGYVFDVEPFLLSGEVRAGRYPTIDYDGMGSAAPTDAGGILGPPTGTITDWVADLEDGRFVADVRLEEDAVLVLKASYHGRWTATIDGDPARPYIVAPGFVAVTVPSGTHEVRFVYGTIGFYPWLFAIGLLCVVVLRFAPPLRRRTATATEDLPELSDARSGPG